jgi:hypothetical protein
VGEKAAGEGGELSGSPAIKAPSIRGAFVTTPKTAISLSIGDRTLPLEANFRTDVDRTHDLVGTIVEVSPLGGGDLKGKSGQKATVLGVFTRLGSLVGLEVEIGGRTYYGATKDFYITREYLEDIQPPTATSASLREALSHWSTQRDYWHTQADGLEAFCFDLASATPRALPECHSWGWRFLVPSPMPGDRASVDCRAPLHGNFWSLGTTIYPERLSVEPDAALIEDHWARVFTWAHYVASGMVAHGYPWGDAVKSLRVRAEATSRVLRPLVDLTLAACLQAKQDLTGRTTYYAPGSLSVAFSNVRLKASTIGLLEPPTDRRPYAVMSVSPSAARKRDYLEQVVLHECLHFVVESDGGDPHDEMFMALSQKLGLRPEHRD